MTRLVTRTQLRGSVNDVFTFLSEPQNMKRVYPHELALMLEKTPEKMTKGSEILFRVTILGQRFDWKSRITAFNPPSEFTDEAIGPPFKRFVHHHRLIPYGSETVMEDEIDLHTTLGPLGDAPAKRVMQRILDYRSQALRKVFGEQVEPTYRDPLRLGLGFGTLSSVLLLLFNIFLVFRLPTGNTITDIILGLVSWFLFWVFTHDLAHLVVGLWTGVRFNHYFIGLSNVVRIKGLLPPSLKLLPIVLGIKIDRNLSKAGRRGLVAMYLAGPLCSMFTPALVPFWILSRNPDDLAGFLVLILTAANIAFTLYFSPKAGCIMKAIRASQTK